MAEVHRQIQVQLEEMVGIPSSEGLQPCRFGSPTLEKQLKRHSGRSSDNPFNYDGAAPARVAVTRVVPTGRAGNP